MKWICGDKRVRPPVSEIQLDKYLKKDFVIVEKDTWNFIQAAYENQNMIYVEIQTGEGRREIKKLDSIKKLWNLLVKFDSSIVDAKAYQEEIPIEDEKPDRLRRKLFSVWITLTITQFLIYLLFYFYFLNDIEFDLIPHTKLKANILFNIMATCVWIGTASGIRGDSFTEDFYSISRHTSPIRFWCRFWHNILIGFIFGLAFIAVSYYPIIVYLLK